MNVLIDTCVWSLALRRRQPVEDPVVHELSELIREGRAAMLGPVRQEALSGIRYPEQFTKLRRRLRAFPDLVLTAEDFEHAAEVFNRCRAAGIQGSNTDFLLCAAAERHDFAIFTTDHDFKAFSKHCSIFIHEPRTSTS